MKYKPAESYNIESADDGLNMFGFLVAALAGLVMAVLAAAGLLWWYFR
jgi:hypothetical protein